MKYHFCLDPDHYSGIAGKPQPDGTYEEHEFNLDMAKRMEKLLEGCGVKVTLTRDKDVVTLQQRVQIANAIKDLDLFFLHPTPTQLGMMGGTMQKDIWSIHPKQGRQKSGI